MTPNAPRVEPVAPPYPAELQAVFDRIMPHVAFFAQRVALTAEQVRATWRVNGDDPVWSVEERLLIRLVDELHDTSGISDGLWRELTAAFSVEQIFELIALVGFYHTVSFFANGFRLAPEPFAAAPPSA